MRLNKSFFCVFFTTFIMMIPPYLYADEITSNNKTPDLECFEFPIVTVSPLYKSYPDPTCNQLRYPAEDCLKEKIKATIEVIDHYQEDGKMNCVGTKPTAKYEAMTNFRGQTSLFFPKHQINVKFTNETSFMGFPKEKTFVFNGPYLDCTLMRNHLAHWLYRNTGRYSSRTRHFVLFFHEKPNSNIPPQYYGIYLLLEKLSYGPKRIHLAKMDASCRGDELDGGWAWQNDPLSYNAYSPNMIIDQYQNEFGMGERPLLTYPNEKEMSQRMRDFFVNTTTGFLPQLYRALWYNMTNGNVLEKHIDLGSFADYILHTEMSLNVDAYRRSTFFFKDRHQTINAGPIWDLNLAYGNGARRNFHGWIFIQYTFWKRIMCHYKLTSLVIQRWIDLRDSSKKGPWSDESIVFFINQNTASIERQLKKCFPSNDWKSNTIQCAFVSCKNNMTFQEQIQDLKNAIIKRSQWMDQHIFELYKELNATKCSGVGLIPKYNCAQDGNDHGCLIHPEKYYRAIKFPPIRTPYQGPQCGSFSSTTVIKKTITMKMVNTSYDFPSEDYCWKSAGIYVYPEQKGVREKTLTTFCNGYGTCPQGPNAKCNCTTGILLEKKTCKRIDADYYNNERIKKKTNILSTKKEKQIDKISLINIIFIVAFLVGAIFIGLKHLKTKRKRLLLDKYHPVGYGSVEEYRRFSNSLTSQTIGAVTSGYIDEYSQVSNQRF